MGNGIIVLSNQEGIALSPAKALLELPVIGTNHNEIPEHVIHEETGLLVNEYEFDGMAEAKFNLINDRGKRLTFGGAGRKMSSCCAFLRRDKRQLSVRLIQF